MSFKFGAAKVFAFFILFFVIYIPLSAQSPPAADSIYRLPAGTHIRLRMQGDIGSKFSSVDDTFLTRVALPVVVRDVTVLPMGVVIEGRIIKAIPASSGMHSGEIDVRMETMRFSDSLFRQIDAEPTGAFKAKRRGKLLPLVCSSLVGAAVGFAVGSAPGALVGAGIGSGIGAGTVYSLKGRDIRLKEDDVFEIVLKKDVVLPVLDY